jgi:hypothetical protein
MTNLIFTPSVTVHSLFRDLGVLRVTKDEARRIAAPTNVALWPIPLNKSEISLTWIEPIIEGRSDFELLTGLRLGGGLASVSALPAF